MCAINVQLTTIRLVLAALGLWCCCFFTIINSQQHDLFIDLPLNELSRESLINQLLIKQLGNKSAPDSQLMRPNNIKQQVVRNLTTPTTTTTTQHTRSTSGNQQLSSLARLSNNATTRNNQQASNDDDNQTTTHHQVMHARQVPAQQVSNLTSSSLSNIRLRWRQMDKSIGESLGTLASGLSRTLGDLQQQVNISFGCKLALGELVEGVEQQQLWASQLLDSSARLPSGLLEGTLTELGNFDQCLAVSHRLLEMRPSHGRHMSGQYCSVQIKPALTPRPRLHTVCQRLPALINASANRTLRLFSQNSHHFYYVGLRLGLCTPSKCTRTDIQQLLTAYLSKFELIGQVKSCQVGASADSTATSTAGTSTTSNSIDFVQQCIVSTFAALLLLSGLGTLLDWLSSSQQTSSRVKKREFTVDLGNNGAAMGFAQAGLPGSDHHLHYHGSSSVAAAAAARRAYGKRWHYQVYRSGVGACELHSSSQDSESQSPESLQRNPLMMGGGDGEQPPNVANDSKLETKLAGEDLLTVVDDSKRAIITADDGLEESWIAQLEQNQQPVPGISNNKSNLSNNKSKQRSQNGSNWKHQATSFLLCFSLSRNLRTIGKFSGTSGSASSQVNECEMGDIKVIHGLRTLTMIWIIFGHTIGLVSPEMMNNLFSLAQLSCSSRLLQALLNATLAVNTFFMMSGLVTVISFARKCKSGLFLAQQQKHKISRSRFGGIKSSSYSDLKPRRRHNTTTTTTEDSSMDSSSIISSLSSSASSNRCIGRTGTTGIAVDKNAIIAAQQHQLSLQSKSWPPKDFQPFIWLLMRYLRLTPTYASVLAFSILLPALGSGPFWQESVTPMGTACRRNWWLNLLYVNNFIETDKLCLIHSWYLSNDWQFFALTLLIFAAMYKSKKLALLLMICLASASTAATFAITITNDFPPTIVTTSPAIAERWTFIHSLYYKPWPHLTSYLVGLVVGYLIVIKERIHLTPTGRSIAWILFSLIALTLLNSIYPWNMGLQVEPLLTGLHSATFRTLWSCCCGWFVFALVTRPSGQMAKLFGWKGFQVTSRLTYCAYLVHPLIIYYHFGTLRERMDSSVYGQFHRFAATLALTYLTALFLSLFVEGPSIQLQRLLIGWFNPSENQPASGGLDGLMQMKKRHSDQSSAANSWSATSSFDEQLTSVGSMVASAESFKVLLADNNNNNSVNLITSTCPQHQQIGAQPDTTESTAIKKVHDGPVAHLEAQQQAIAGKHQLGAAENPIAALDAEFQQKLAQAISRGFRIRSRLANETIKHLGGIRSGQHKRLAQQLQKQPQQGHANRLPVNTCSQYIDDPTTTNLMKLLTDQSSQMHRPPNSSNAKRDTELSTFATNNRTQQRQQHTANNKGRPL